VQPVKPPYKVVYYRTALNSQPVKEYIDSLASRQPEWQKVTNLIGRLREFGSTLVEPHSKQVRGKLYELRDLTYNHRILYQASGPKLFVLLHIIKKKQGRIPDNDISTAEARWKDLESRFQANPIVPPRPYGADAP
jgi:phage-related protein